jgi:mannose/fructose/N-acetylgalactosamine-specific phosphotransferase system component IID
MSDTETPVTHEDSQPALPELTKRELSRSFWRYFWSFQISWNYERMQGMGFAWAMEPVLRKLFSRKADYIAAMKRHMVFFNTDSIIGGPLILGSAIAMEEAGAPASAEGMKVGLMGPMAGVGDTLTFALYNSIIFTIGASWALQGKVIGPIFAGVMVLVPYFLVRRWQFYFAYRQGKQLASTLAGGALDRLSESATILGLVVLGGFIPSIVHVVTVLTYKQTIILTSGKHVTQTVPLQTQFNAVLPFVFAVALTAGVYFTLTKLKWSPLVAIACVFAIGLALGWLGWFAPILPVAAAH